VKTQPTTQSVPLSSYAIGFVVGLLAPIVFEVLVAGYISWSGFFAIFTGLLGAILGGYVAVLWKPVSPERKQLTAALFPKLCIIVGVIVAFWVPAMMTFRFFTRNNGENAILGVIYGICAGTFITPLGALSGKYLAQYLMKVWSEEDSPH
jgi:hypothetical protein